MQREFSPLKMEWCTFKNKSCRRCSMKTNFTSRLSKTWLLNDSQEKALLNPHYTLEVLSSLQDDNYVHDSDAGRAVEFGDRSANPTTRKFVTKLFIWLQCVHVLCSLCHLQTILFSNPFSPFIH